MSRFTGNTVAGGLGGLLAVTFPKQAKAKAEVKAKADAVAKAMADAKAERARQATLRHLRASRARSAVLACPVCLRVVEGRSAASVLYKLLNGAEVTVTGYACQNHVEGEAFGSVGIVQRINRNVDLTLEPMGRFYIAQAKVTKVLHEAPAPKAWQTPGPKVPTVDNSLCRIWCTSVYAKVFDVSRSTAGKRLRTLVKLGNATKQPRKGNAEIVYTLVNGFTL